MINTLLFSLAALLMQESSLDGVVIQAGTSETLSKVLLELRSADAADIVQYTVTSRENGRFAFRNVRPGNYRLVASRVGYVRSEYGQRKTKGRGVPIAITAGQNVSGVQVAMTPTAAIYGRIYDGAGQPIVKAEVRAMKPAYLDGRRTLNVVQSTVTNDLGEYRLFWLAPGSYYVGAVPPGNAAGIFITINSDLPAAASGGVQGGRYGSYLDPLAPVTFPENRAETARYQTVFFPNTTDEQAAQAVNLMAGASEGGIDITVTPARTRRVRGVVLDGDTGLPAQLPTPQPVQVIISPSVQGPSNPFADRTTGAFDIQTLPEATVLTGLLGMRIGRVFLPRGETDLDGVRIALTSGYSLTGQILFEGTQPGNTDSRLPALRVTLRPDPQIYTPQVPPGSGVPSNAGNFTVQNVNPGTYRINVAPILNLVTGPAAAIPAALRNAYVKSIRYGDSEALDNALRIDGQPAESLTIVVATNPGSAVGVVFNDAQEPQSDVTVVLIPANQRSRVDLYKSAVTDASGKFLIERIPPGDYLAFAFDEIETGAWLDAQFMKAFVERGKPLRVTEGAKLDIHLAVIPTRK